MRNIHDTISICMDHTNTHTGKTFPYEDVTKIRKWSHLIISECQPVEGYMVHYNNCFRLVQIVLSMHINIYSIVAIMSGRGYMQHASLAIGCGGPKWLYDSSNTVLMILLVSDLWTLALADVRAKKC